MPLKSVLAALARDLDQLGVRWALVGGLAVSIRSEPRLTRDVDVCVGVAGDREAEVLVKDLRTLGYEVLMILEQEAVHRLATVRLLPPGGDLQGAVVDLLFASSGIEDEVASRAERLPFPGHLRPPVASLGHLIAMKLLARDDRNRPQDHDDLRALVREAGPEDLAVAREAVDLIMARGFNRGRDLPAALESWLARDSEQDPR